MLQASRIPSGLVAGIAVHGTGTPLGDPIGEHALSSHLLFCSDVAAHLSHTPLLLCAPEIGAIGGALGSRQRPLQPLLLISVKSVYGHTEGAAGRPAWPCLKLFCSLHAGMTILCSGAWPECTLLLQASRDC